MKLFLPLLVLSIFPVSNGTEIKKGSLLRRNEGGGGPSMHGKEEPPTRRLLRSRVCKNWCFENVNDWQTKCNWKKCNGCDACEPVAPTKPWNFTVMADLHSFWFVERNFDTLEAIASNIQQNYGGGSLLMTPGDTVSWGGLKSNSQMKELAQREGLVENDATYSETAYSISLFAFQSSKELFWRSGFDVVLPTIGDHEIGGNEGFRVGVPKSKVMTIPSFRQGFADGSMKVDPTDSDYTLFTEDIYGTPSRPLGTSFESYAYVHRNALFISVDAFRLVNDGKSNYIDREEGFGGEGAITCDVNGQHLAWFEAVLKAVEGNPTIKHVFVEAHLPILQPVRKVQCSGQFLDREDESPFWLLMNQYGVDVYFAGEVHSNTVSKTKNANSNLIQIVSRGNFFGGFLTLHIEDNYIEIKHFNEIGPDLRFNNDFVEDGILKIWKADPANVVIESSGELLILDDEVALLEFGFESITPMGGTRQVLGLRTDEDRIAPWVVMGGANCTEALENVGSFGAQYDAQVANLVLFSPGRDGTGYAGVFSSDTSFGIYGTGPPTHGEIVSVEMWIKTSAGTNSEMVLASYFAYWGFGHDKDHLLLTLDKGIPTFYLRKKQAHKASIADPLTDDAWHHIVLTMPGKSCRSSEMILYVDGDRVELISSVSGEKDRHIFFGTNGRMGFGGFGYAFIKAKDYYSGMVNYEGLMDDVKVYSRTIAP